MRFLTFLLVQTLVSLRVATAADQKPLLPDGPTDTNVTPVLFTELEELARIVDISYCVGITSGISKPFTCISRCSEFPGFELINAWNTGPLLSDSCGYVAVDHDKQRIIVAFRGTYSIANTIVDLSTVPQEYTPYPGSDGDDDEAPPSNNVLNKIINGIGGHSKREVVSEHHDPKCDNCTVHSGFHTSWLHTRKAILPDLEEQVLLHPDYALHLVGHSLGGAVAALAALDTHARGWNPTVTTFGEPRIGNAGLARFIDDRFDLHRKRSDGAHDDISLKYRRVTHVNDPVPLLPLSEWGYAMHAGEIHIAKSSLSPDISDLYHCKGDNDPQCIAGQDSTAFDEESLQKRDSEVIAKRDLIGSVKDEIHDVVNEPWGIPSRYKLWQLFFAHRDYFWRLGLCVPGGDPFGGGGKYEL